MVEGIIASPPSKVSGTDELTRPSYLSGRRSAKPWWRVPAPWTIYRYVVVEIFRICLLGILAVSLMYTAFAAYQAVRSGLQLSLIWPLLTKTFAYPLYFSIPISLLFGVTLALGRMVQDLEISAMRTHGLSHTQLLIPVFVLAAFFCGVSIHVNGWVVPDIHYEKRNLQSYVLEQLENLGSGINRTLLLPDGAGSLFVEEYEGTNLWHINIDLHMKGRADLFPDISRKLSKLPPTVKILARQGKVELTKDRASVILRLRGVDVLVPEPVRDAAGQRFHQKFTISGNVVIPLSFAPKTPGIKDQTQPELIEHIAELRKEVRRLRMFDRANLAYASHSERRAEGDAKVESGTGRTQSIARLSRRIASAKTEFHRRLGFSLSCLTFPVVGVALTLLLQGRSRLLPFFLANLLVIGVFYPLLTVSVSLGKSGFLPVLAVVLPNICVLGVGIFLMRKVLRQ